MFNKKNKKTDIIQMSKR